MGGTEAPEDAWRAELADKLSWATLIALTAAAVISYAGMVTPPRVIALTISWSCPSVLSMLAKPFEPYRLLETIDELRRAPASKQQEPMQSIA